MLLDEIIGELNKETAPGEQNPTQNAPEVNDGEKTRLNYSEEFWTRFRKPTTAPEGN